MKPDFHSFLFRVTRFLPLAVVNANQSELFALFAAGKSAEVAALHVILYGEQAKGANLQHN